MTAAAPRFAEQLENAKTLDLGEARIAQGFLVSLFLATEARFRRGRAIGTSLAESTKSELSALQGAMIGLLALLLAFSLCWRNRASKLGVSWSWRSRTPSAAFT